MSLKGDEESKVGGHRKGAWLELDEAEGFGRSSLVWSLRSIQR